MLKIEDYPKWVAVDGPGHPGNPGKVLVENADQEAEAAATGKGPEHLNPPVDEARAQAQAVAPVAQALTGGVSDKPLGEQSRAEMCATLASILIQSPLSDDEIRSQIEALQHWLDHRDARPGDDEDRPEFDHASDAGPAPAKDVAGDTITPPQDQEANKDQLAPGERTQPLPEPDQATGTTPPELEEREAGTQPAVDQVKQAETPTDEPLPPEEGGAPAAKAKAAKAK